jgi:hypothetical protein
LEELLLFARDSREIYPAQFERYVRPTQAILDDKASVD